MTRGLFIDYTVRVIKCQSQKEQRIIKRDKMRLSAIKRDKRHNRLYLDERIWRSERMISMTKRNRSNKIALTVSLILRALVLLTAVRALFRRDFESLMLCVLTLFLFILPGILEKRLRIELPNTLEVIILFFIYAAEILGEINNFYVIVPHWDTMLHTFNGFACAAIGFALVDMLNRAERFTFRLSPLFLAIVAFCFSMTIGVLWEFFEYGADHFFYLDMQKDAVVTGFSSVALDKTHSNKAITVSNISDVIIVYSDGNSEALGLGGYLDIGINDTMKDLLVNLLGAAVFSVIGYFYVKQRGRGRFAARFIPRVLMRDESEK